MIVALIEGEKPRLLSLQRGRHENLLGIHRKMSKATPETEQWLFRIAILLILGNRMGHRLTGNRILHLARENRQTIEEKPQIQALLVCERVFETARGILVAQHLEKIPLIELLQFRIASAGWWEKAQVEMRAALVHPLAQRVQRPLLLYHIPHPLDDPAFHLVSQFDPQRLPRLRLSHLEKAHQRLRNQAKLAVVVLRRGRVEAIQLHQIGDDGVFKILLGGGFWHDQKISISVPASV